MERLSKDAWIMGIARLTAGRSTCLKLSVGCVLTDDKYEQLAVGYNGVCRGLPNGCLHPEISQGCGCVHAEINACVKCRFVPTQAFITVSPCVLCAQALVNCGVLRVVYAKTHHRQEGLEVLKSCGVIVEEFVS